ncbi:hypothetical protein H8356DRAFT_963518 [Neocallimastix lanati (nom. inval.)]|nr:hypothetical protein H8356DRAFT_963518 [Neocallimastix sp. JGI-2020a]
MNFNEEDGNVEYDEEKENEKENEEENRSKNREVFNIQSALNLKKYEISIFYYFESLNKKCEIINVIEVIFIFIECIQLITLFNDSSYFPNIPKSILSVLEVFTIKNLISRLTNIILGVSSSVRKIPDSIVRELYYSQTYYPLSGKINSVYSIKTKLIYRIVIILQILNMGIFQKYFKNQYISSIIMCIGYTYLLCIHLINQNYHCIFLNRFFSGIWFSIALQSFLYVIFTLIKVTPFYPVFVGLLPTGFILGWIINIIFYNMYSKVIYKNIKRKFNKHHVIQKIKEQKEKIERSDDSDDKSFETIVNQYERLPDIYIQYWNFLHGIIKFISTNRICYVNKLEEDIDELLDKLNYTAEKNLYKCATLSKTFIKRYLVYNASFTTESDKLVTRNNNSGSLENSSSDFELIEIKNRSIQYHLAALNILKNLMNSLRTLETASDIENVMIINDELTEILNEAESHFKKYVIRCNYSKDSLELYILFLRNSLNRNDLAKYEVDEKQSKYIKGNNSVYERSEKFSSSITSDMENRKAKVLKNIVYNKSFINFISYINIYSVITRSPVVISSIKYDVRLLSLATAAGIDPTNLTYTENISTNLEYIEQTYIPNIYKVHNIDPKGYSTINPIEIGVVDRLLDLNYFKTLMKIDRKARIILRRVNNTEIRYPDYLDNKDIRSLPQNYFGEHSNEYNEQIQEICNNYGVEDEGFSKKKKKNKRASSKKIKTIFILYCFIEFIFILVPFTFVFMYNSECRNLMNLLIHSTERAYYLKSIIMHSSELILNDEKYYTNGEALRLMIDSGDHLRVFIILFTLE